MFGPKILLTSGELTSTLNIRGEGMDCDPPSSTRSTYVHIARNTLCLYILMFLDLINTIEQSLSSLIRDHGSV